MENTVDENINSISQTFQIDVVEDRNMVIETKHQDNINFDILYSDQIKELGYAFVSDICVHYAIDSILLSFDKQLHQEQILKQTHEFTSDVIHNDLTRISNVLTMKTDGGEMNNPQIDEYSWNIEEEVRPISIDIWAKNRIPKNMKQVEPPKIIMQGRVIKERTMSQTSTTSRISTSLSSTVRMNKLSLLDKDKSMLVTRRFKSNDLAKEDEFSQRIKQYNNSIEEKKKNLEELELKEQEEFDSLKNKMKGNNNYILDRNGQIILVNNLKNYKSSYLDLDIKTYDIDCDQILGKIINQNNNVNIPKNTPQYIPRENKNIIESISLSKGVKITNKPKSEKQLSIIDEPEIKNNRKTLLRTPKTSTVIKDKSTSNNTEDNKTDDKSKNDTTKKITETIKNKIVNETKNTEISKNIIGKIAEKVTKATLPKIILGDDPLNRTAPPSVNKSKLSPSRLENLPQTKTRQVHSSYKSNAPILPSVLPSKIQRPQRTSSPMKIIERNIRGEMRRVVAFTDGSGRQHLSKSGSLILTSVDDIHSQSPINPISSSFSMSKTTYGEKYLEGIKE